MGSETNIVSNPTVCRRLVRWLKRSMIFPLGSDRYGRQGASCPKVRRAIQKPMDCVIQNRVKIRGISTLCRQYIQNKHGEKKNTNNGNRWVGNEYRFGSHRLSSLGKMMEAFNDISFR